MINRYLQTRYRRHGRGPEEFDCWGLVRAARAELFGRALLPSFGAVDPANKTDMTRAANDAMANHLVESSACAGAIAMGWRARLCVHVGLVVEVDGRRWILETDQHCGPVLTRVADFERRYLKTVYFDDSNLSLDPAV